MKINEEIINNKLYFYHSAKDLSAALYIVNKKWRTYMGMYGNGVYGQQYADPADPRNKLNKDKISRYKDMYGSSYRFKIEYTHPEELFYLDLDAGKEVYPDYSVDKGIEILKNHKVPQNLINTISNLFSNKKDIPVLSGTIFNTGPIDGGLLGEYGFKGLVYSGNLDGSCVLYWYPNSSDLKVVEYSNDFGKTWISYDSNNKTQVNNLRSEIQDAINRNLRTLNNRISHKSSTGRTPLLTINGEDRDWVRVIECGDKAGYDFKNGDFDGGNFNKFISLVQAQITKAKEPKKSRRYNVAITLMPEAEKYLTK